MSAWHEIHTSDLPDEVRRWAVFVLAQLEQSTPIDRDVDHAHLTKGVELLLWLGKEMGRIAGDVLDPNRNARLEALRHALERMHESLVDEIELIHLADRYNETLTNLPDVDTVREVESIFAEQEGES